MKLKVDFPEFGQLEFENGILYVRISEGLELTEQIAEKILVEGEKLASDSKFCVLVDVRKNVSSTSEARKYSAKNPYIKNHLAYAMLADTMPVIILSNFFIKVNRPLIPTRLFKNEEEAVKWLQTFLS